MQYQELELLLQLNEHTHLDFKAQYGSNPDFVHDILCMSNVLGEKPRHLVYGVSDRKEILGIPEDQRRQLNNVIDTLRGARLNFMPHLELFDCLCPDNKVVQVLRIHGDAYKPYWLIQDYTFQGRTIRAGAVYTRLGDRNVAPNESTPEKLVDAMFRERFGLDKSPLERFKIYVLDHSNWKHDRDTYGGFFYYEPFPEFTIRELGHDRELTEFFEPWTLLFPDQKAFRDEYEVRYHATKLLSYYEVSCDGGRFQTVLPAGKTFGSINDELFETFYLDRSKVQFDIHEMIQTVRPNVDNRSIYLQFPEFDSREEAERELTADYEANKEHFQYFVFDKSCSAYCALNRGNRKEIFLGPSCPQHLRKK